MEKGSWKGRVLLSYDIDATNAKVRAKVNRLIFGSTVTRSWNGHRRTYRYRGVLDHPKARYIGQSVLLLPRDLAGKVASRLRSLGVNCATLEVRVRT